MARPDGWPRAVLFDLDDTLCDYAGAREGRLRIAFARALRDAGIEAPDPVIDQMIAESIAIHPHGVDHFGPLLARYGVEQPDAVTNAMGWYRQHRFHGLALFADALATIAAVRRELSAAAEASARPIGIITNGPTEVQRAKLDYLGLGNHVDFAIVSEEFGAEKPEPAIFHEALRLASVGPEDALFVGDSLEFDILGAVNAGIPSVWVNRYGLPAPTKSFAPTHVVSSLAGLSGVLFGDAAALESGQGPTSRPRSVRTNLGMRAASLPPIEGVEFDQ